MPQVVPKGAKRNGKQDLVDHAKAMREARIEKLKRQPKTKLQRNAHKRGPYKKREAGSNKALTPYKLRPGEAAFVAESLKPGTTKAEAARRAGLDYVPSSKGVVEARLSVLQKALTTAEVTTERTLLEIARVAYWDPRKMFDEQGNLIPITELDYDTAAAIAGLEVERRTEGHGDEKEVYHVLKVKIASKVAALDLLTRLDLEAQRKGASGPMQAAPVFNVQFVKPQLNNGNGDPTVQ